MAYALVNIPFENIVDEDEEREGEGVVGEKLDKEKIVFVDEFVIGQRLDVEKLYVLTSCMSCISLKF